MAELSQELLKEIPIPHIISDSSSVVFLEKKKSIYSTWLTTASEHQIDLLLGRTYPIYEYSWLLLPTRGEWGGPIAPPVTVNAFLKPDNRTKIRL